MTRLMHPIELENHLREQYEQYLEQNAEVILKVLIPENKVEEISYLCDSCLIPEAALGRCPSAGIGGKDESDCSNTDGISAE